MLGAVFSVWLVVIALLQALGGFGMANAGVPPNPERPMQATTCQDALVRVREAAQGSPLIDAEQNRQHLLDAVAQAERLCLKECERKEKVIAC